MRETWRWFGPDDPVSLADIRQAGASGIVSALHDLLPGTVWSETAITERRAMIEEERLTWDVVESLPVSENIKIRGANATDDLDAWVASLEALEKAGGPKVICWNFMPLMDWTRTDLAWETSTGSQAMRFDLIDFAAFDIAIIERAGAASDYPAAIAEQAYERARDMDAARREDLSRKITAGLPGAAEILSFEQFRERLDAYADLGEDGLRANMTSFLRRVVPVAERLGLKLCCHPDDPPWPLLGLPRILSTESDFLASVQAAPSVANGVTFCTGSFGARPDNDLPSMVERLGPHIHFLHLRNVTRESDGAPCSFHEAAHLEGDNDMVAVIRAVLAEEARRVSDGRSDAEIPMRPDHGQAMLSDLAGPYRPGYPAIGRLRGLAEMRGIAKALSQ